ncbi:hypothetical protein [Winogradskyella aquimaris]|uniref:Uncharacterized protein n=1 Tax=Winogradskyella aquimaris TaxID=864074 RepID=A0ABU5EJT5_9FLAO|nr:hypothetical protein [Winogradskyella aquimaris]MDY2586513.1 hypothetical protein [Winogradskyella aquimaris]
MTKISTLTREIEEHYPELIKFLDESRSTLPNNSGEVALKNSDLKDYLEQLQSLIENYNSKD